MQETSEFRVGDRLLVLTEWGTGTAPNFLVVHGIGMGREAYLELIEALGRSRKVIAVDLPGFGDSPQPDRPLSIPQMAELVADYLDASGGEPVVAIGHSMGAQVVAELAVLHPQLVSKLVLIGPTVNARERTFGWQALRMSQELAEAGPKVFLRALILYAKAGPSWYLRTLRAMMQHHIEDVAPRITTPTLVMRGQRDRICPEPWVRSVAAAIPGSQLEQVPGKSHEAMISSAQPVADLITDFVRG